MRANRRTFLKWSATAGLAAGAAGAPTRSRRRRTATCRRPIRALRPMTAGIVPITIDERRARIEKARRLMAENRIAAILVEGGSSLFYFTGVRWGQSERPFVAVIPAKGELAWVCPGFEEARARELIKFGTDIRTWQEDESPYRAIAQILKDRGIATGRVGVEERLRFFVFNGVKSEAPALDYVSADPVTAGCRMIKSPAEIALMQRANDMTIAAYKAGLATLREGMTQGDLRSNILAAYARASAPQSPDVAVSFGEYTAFPHGSITPQKLKEGDVVQIDDGCKVDGYRSDITRTVVFGKPTQAADRRLEPRAPRAGRRVRRREAGRAVRSGRRRRAQGDHRRRLRPRLQGARACPTAPATASASTFTSGRTSCAATRRRCSPACASATSR